MIGPLTGIRAWVLSRDPNLAALRRAGRGAIVMPAAFAVGEKVVENPNFAVFAAFGSFSMLLLVDFSGPMRTRLGSQAALGLAGACLVCVGTLASRSTWTAVAVTAVVALGILFSGVVSSVLAGATVSLLLALILPVSIAAPASAIPERLAGWGTAAAASLLAIWLLWPAPTADRLRGAAIAACRALAAQIRTNAEYLLSGGEAQRLAHDEAVERASAATTALQRTFLATPYRPTGLSTAARAVVRLVDEIAWLDAIVAQSPVRPAGTHANGSVCAVKSSAANVLDRAADLLEGRSPDATGLTEALAGLRDGLSSVETATIADLPPNDDGATAVVSALDPSFRAQELAFAASQIAENAEIASAADRRSWLRRMLGRRPSGLPGTVSAFQQRAVAHFEPHSVWLHNSLRGAAGLSLAVLVASMSGVQHSFWVVLGTLSVLRSNALSTGQSVVRGLAGTAAGVVVGGAIVALIGTNTTLLWILLPLAVLVAGFAPAAVSFEAGQAAFTVTIVILFNIIAPAGWRVGLVRIEDVAIGFAVSLVVGLLFWPRGAGKALAQELAEAYADSARYLAAAVEFGAACCDRQVPPPPEAEAVRAAATARRLDDAFRTFLAERAAKKVPLADVTGLVNGVVGVRLAADAVLDLWERGVGAPDGGDRQAARAELTKIAGSVVGWYDELAAALLGGGSVPEPLDRGEAAVKALLDAVGRDLHDGDGNATDTGVRIIWTGDHLDAARRLQATLVGPARAVTGRMLAPGR